MISINLIRRVIGTSTVSNHAEDYSVCVTQQRDELAKHLRRMSSLSSEPIDWIND
ncbi:MAG: hypothetical protein OEQ39_23330 [Gammaproteobacteria bacterium]|nr:hypothetical protein [Gammaproteobacteria bacterium]